jgi:hypothetical protein
LTISPSSEEIEDPAFLNLALLSSRNLDAAATLVIPFSSLN